MYICCFFIINIKSNLVISNSAKKTKTLSFDTSKCNNVFFMVNLNKQTLENHEG